MRLLGGLVSTKVGLLPFLFLLILPTKPILGLIVADPTRAGHTLSVLSKSASSEIEDINEMSNGDEKERVVLLVGSCGLDRLLTVTNYPDPDAKVRTTAYNEMGGGTMDEKKKETKHNKETGMKKKGM